MPFPDTDVRLVDIETGQDVPLGKPGEIIKKLSEDKRKILRKLKSDDISSDKISDRYAGWADYIEPYEKSLSRMKMEFDEKVLKRKGKKR